MPIKYCIDNGANRIGSGKHWTAEEVANKFSPAPESKNAVLKWLVDSGIERPRISLSKGKHLSNASYFDLSTDPVQVIIGYSLMAPLRRRKISSQQSIGTTSTLKMAAFVLLSTHIACQSMFRNTSTLSCPPYNWTV